MKYNRYNIFVVCQLWDKNGNICYFEADSLNECKKVAKDMGIKNYCLKWAAFEEIDGMGNTNIPVYGNTKREAISNIKKILSK